MAPQRSDDAVGVSAQRHRLATGTSAADTEAAARKETSRDLVVALPHAGGGDAEAQLRAVGEPSESGRARRAGRKHTDDVRRLLGAARLVRQPRHAHDGAALSAQVVVLRYADNAAAAGGPATAADPR